MSFYWIGWYQPTEDCRPKTFPPNDKILGWWITGERVSFDAAKTLVAAVVADNEEDAKLAVQKEWPEAEEWRFCDQKDNFDRIGDRFSIEDTWMKARFDQYR